MSDLFQKKDNKQKKSDEDSSEEEEERDQFEDPTSKKAIHREFPHFSNGPIRALPMLPHPKPPASQNQSQDPNSIDMGLQFLSSSSQTGKDLSPLQWNSFYDSMEYLENGTPVYIAGSSGPLFLALHGAGDTACSFACLAKEIKQFGTFISFDFRGHGASKIESSDDLSIETLIQDTQVVYQYIRNKYPDLCIIIIGHSMGGSVAAKFTQQLLAQGGGIKDIIQGLIVIDVVEGTAIEALPFMQSIVSSRPPRFDSYESAIKWHTRTSQVRNVQSARVSVPPKLKKVEINGKVAYEWRVDLMKSEKHWMGWFKGLTSCFLSVHIPKLLMLAEKERMDKDLTIAQMQGKFKLLVLQDVGHYMQEDSFKKTAFNLHLFLDNFRIPVDKTDVEKYKVEGIGKFHSNIKPYSMTFGA